MSRLASSFEQVLRKLALKYKAENETILLNLVVNSDYSIEENTSYDNWNGGIHGHTVHFLQSEEIFLSILKERIQTQKKVATDISDLMNIDDEFITEVVFELLEETGYSADWRSQTGVLAKRKVAEVHEADKTRIWAVGGLKLFISHKVEYKIEASDIRDKFAPLGISCFVAHEDIEPNRKWQDEIEKALGSMDAIVVMLTENFHDSRWTDQEIGFAVGRGVTVVPIRMGIDPYGFIGTIQAVNGNGDVLRDIFKVLSNEPTLRDKLVDSFISAMLTSNSFSASEQLALYFDLLPPLSTSQQQRLVAAYNENSQVNMCFAFNGGKRGRNMVLEMLNRKEPHKYTAVDRKVQLSNEPF